MKELPRDLGRILMACPQHDLERRPRSAVDVVAALDGLAERDARRAPLIRIASERSPAVI